MPKHNVPGFKASTGMQGFKPLPEGEYHLRCLKAEVLPPKKAEPLDVWTFTWEILAGPPDDGKPTKGRQHKTFVRILHEIHPRFEELKDMGTNELKSMALAAGVQSRGDDVNSDSFVGQEVRAYIVQTPNKSDASKFFNNVREWNPA